MRRSIGYFNSRWVFGYNCMEYRSHHDLHHGFSNDYYHLYRYLYFQWMYWYRFSANSGHTATRRTCNTSKCDHYLSRRFRHLDRNKLFGNSQMVKWCYGQLDTRSSNDCHLLHSNLYREWMCESKFCWYNHYPGFIDGSSHSSARDDLCRAIDYLNGFRMYGDIGLEYRSYHRNDFGFTYIHNHLHRYLF